MCDVLDTIPFEHLVFICLCLMAIKLKLIKRLRRAMEGAVILQQIKLQNLLGF
jgi:hypothetical protein